MGEQTNELVNAMSEFAHTFFHKPASLDGKVVCVQRISGTDNNITISYRDLPVPTNGNLEDLPKDRYGAFVLEYRQDNYRF